jgi:diguanylate cyclase (GGDEF)-like protein/PAS domain S-box-containing protein
LSTPSLVSLRAVIVDAGAESSRAIANCLRSAGFEPAFARVETADAFRATLSLESWDVVLANHALPEFGALQALSILDGHDPDLPLVVVSEAISPELLVLLMRAGARDYVPRRDIERLPKVLERELREAAGRRARRADEQRRREDDERQRALIEEIPALAYVAWADEVGATAYVSPQLRVMTGFSPAEWLADNESWARQIHPEDRERVLAEYRASCASGTAFSSEYRILDKGGRVHWWHDEGRVLTGPDGRARFVRGFVLDVTDRVQAEETIKRMSTHDGLTGLPNRALLQERLTAEIARSRDEGRPLGLLILSLDRFREINNTLGHQNGDLVIQQVARRLGDVLGEAERVARLRGDEFGILLPGADARLAQQIAAKVLAALERPFIVERLPIEVVGSVGVSLFPDHGDDAETLLRRADLAVLAAKRETGSCVVYAPECDPYDPGRLVLLGELRQALEANDLLLHYQPKVDIRAHAVVGAEALLRWRHPRRGMVPPDEFIPLAEKSGLIKPLTRWVLKQAVHECRNWTRGGHRLPVAVNLSARNLQDASLVPHVAELLGSEGVGADQLRVELTESAMMSDPQRAAHSLHELRRTGVEMAIDDFGTGYSSLAYLQTLPVSELKIDKTFVIGMGANGDGKATIVRSTSDLGHNLGLKVVAEGVEDERTLELLGSYGCDGAQGYHIARPMAAPDFRRWLMESPWASAAS